jgi:hypothetical protein
MVNALSTLNDLNRPERSRPRPLHDFGHDPLPALEWVAEPRPAGDANEPGGCEARLTGALRFGPLSLYVELVEVGYTEGGCQEFVAEQGVGLNECERTCGPDIHRAIDGVAETFAWKGKEYTLVVLPYAR